MSGDHNQHQADQCEHLWRYTGSKRQAVWQCPYCESLGFVEPPAKEWVGLTDDETHDLFMANNYVDDYVEFEMIVDIIEAKLREKNSVRPVKNNDICGND